MLQYNQIIISEEKEFIHKIKVRFLIQIIINLINKQKAKKKIILKN